MKFVLILTLFGLDGPDYDYVVQSDLGGVDCITLLEHHHKLMAQTVNRADFRLTCGVDYAEP